MDSTATRTVARWPEGSDRLDQLAVEEPLEIRLDGTPFAVVMRSPGHDSELAAGFLVSENIVEAADDVAAIEPLGTSGNVIGVNVASGSLAHREAVTQAARELYVSSGCGVCGKTSIDAVHLSAPPLPPAPDLDPALLATLPDQMVLHQAGFASTGGLHAAALFDFDGNIEVLREDIGRHNAVDKVIGWRFLQDRLPIQDRILVVSSRAGFEIIQKALMARIPAVVAVGAASTLAVDLAVESGLVLMGFAREDRLTDYTTSFRSEARSTR